MEPVLILSRTSVPGASSLDRTLFEVRGREIKAKLLEPPVVVPGGAGLGRPREKATPNALMADGN